jgi:hypothetical protein
VPKPAFELTPKKLDPKALTSGSEKAAAKKAKKTVAKAKLDLRTDEKAHQRRRRATLKPRRSQLAAARFTPPGAAAGKKSPARSSNRRQKAESQQRRPKPSPAIAKTPASQEPSD